MASHATQVLKDGQIVTVDSRSVGGVYQGNMLGV